YAYKERKNVDSNFKLGEGLVGQCAIEKTKILLMNVPQDYIKITSGLGDAVPLNVIVMPVVFEGQVKAVLELASFERFSPTHQTFLDQLTESIGIVLNTIEANMRTEDLLKQSQSLAKELQSRQEELQQTNAQLEDKAKLLAEQNVEVERKNYEVEQARQALEEKAKQLALTSKYKSEFLANMSHELRTPLNSLLILSDRLSMNQEHNLTSKQVDFAKIIHSSGNDLLNLINDILDLSKIESGTVIVDVGEIGLRDLHDYVARTFRHVAEAKRLEFILEFSPNLPRLLHTDAKRLQQILKNLLSNAFKFTERGGVTLVAAPAAGGWSSDHEALNRARSVVAFSVCDTGIGIPTEKQQIIFEAFHQADGSTSRKYGGTGLGLAISREISKLLGGEIRLTSAPGEGSTFTFYLPTSYPYKGGRKPQPGPVEPTQSTAPTVIEVRSDSGVAEAVTFANPLGDDADVIESGDRVLLIVENDPGFAMFLVDMAHEYGFKAVVTARGAAALSLARGLKPDAMTLDINLPDIDGWMVLDRLKDDTETRHIPVHVITTEEESARGLRMGAMGVLSKPVKTKDALDETFSRIRAFLEPGRRNVLVVEQDEARLARLVEWIGGDDVNIEGVGARANVLRILKDRHFDLVVAGLQPSDSKGFDLIEELRELLESRSVPLIVYTEEELSKKEEVHLKRLTQTAALKDVRSRERLIDESSLFLHRVVERMPPERREVIEKLHEAGAVLASKKVLIVDDDIRNIFAMTSVLEPQQMQVLSAENGKDAIEVLSKTPDLDAVLMDIMMPDMDGYDTMRAIRKLPKFRTLPIIALTAKAMKGDREKCIEAGASDYISKPVDTAQLLAILRLWLHR
ncbi:MAG TPA: response regulator, partial [Planctomycetota bacterium]|nr:response regulator [Planctomycetota bacterium]